MAKNSLLEWALKYAARGLPVFPCKPNKRPYTKNGFHDASMDQGQIKEWWGKWPDASIGMATGEKAGVWVLDADIYKPEGQQAYKQLIDNNGPLPRTRTQQTGGGGKQFFFRHPGYKIASRNGFLGTGLDVKGDGGYVLLPPSTHESGGTYKWIQDIPAGIAPDWLLELVRADREPEPVAYTPHTETGAYGKKALADEIIKLSMAGEGTRNETLNQCAFSLGQLVAGGELEHDHVVNSLLGVATSIGLKKSEATKTIKSGIKGGSQRPRTAPEKDDIQYSLPDDANDTNDTFDIGDTQCPPMTSDDTQCPPMISNDTPMTPDDKKTPYNLKANIYEFIKNSKGSFTTRDIDAEFGLSTKREKKTRSQALYMARKEKLIKIDRRGPGRYQIIDSDIDWIDLDAEEPEAFPIKLPFDLHKFVKIPPKAIIVLAGSSNAGKTAFILNALRQNLKQDYPILYLMSEMGSGEFKTRIKGFQEPISAWKKIKAASKSSDFDGTIQHHNPDGLTCVDYLEEVEGEYFKIASSIRDIYDALGNGVAFVAIQKKSDSQFARGGEGTMEKARLYMTLDYIATEEHAIICALKITKAKQFEQKNLTNHELHFRLTRGAQIEPITDWMLSSKVDRKKEAAKYESGRDDIGDHDFLIPTVEGRQVAIKEHTWRKWQENMENIDVEWELKRIVEDSNNKKPFIKYKSVMFQLSGILKKINDERG